MSATGHAGAGSRFGKPRPAPANEKSDLVVVVSGRRPRAGSRRVTARHSVEKAAHPIPTRFVLAKAGTVLAPFLWSVDPLARGLPRSNGRSRSWVARPHPRARRALVVRARLAAAGLARILLCTFLAMDSPARGGVALEQRGYSVGAPAGGRRPGKRRTRSCADGNAGRGRACPPAPACIRNCWRNRRPRVVGRPFGGRVGFSQDA